MIAYDARVSRDQDSGAVLAANESFYAAFEKLDDDAMSLVWAGDAPVSCIHPRGDLIEGREGVLASLQNIFRSTDAIRFDLVRARAFVAGDTAWVVLFERIESRHGERTLRAETQATNVFVREGGAWKLVHHHAEPATAKGMNAPPAKGQMN